MMLSFHTQRHELRNLLNATPDKPSYWGDKSPIEIWFTEAVNRGSFLDWLFDQDELAEEADEDFADNINPDIPGTFHEVVSAWVVWATPIEEAYEKRQS